MRLQLQVFAWIAFVVHLCSAATIAPNDIFITQVVDPGDEYQARYVQLYAVGANEGDVVGGTDFHLKLASNSNTYFNVYTLLSGVVFGPGGFLIVCQSTFSTYYPTDSCDKTATSAVDANGNDAYALVFGDGSGGTIHDLFGTPGANEYFFKDSQAERNVAGPSTTFDITEWTIAGANVADITPRAWELPVTTISPAPSTSAAPSTSPTPLVCTSIQDIQGNDEVSPLSGEDVTVCDAYLTKVKSNGFYLQEVPTKDPSYSSGIFVFDRNHSFGAGDEGKNVIVSGTVSEYYGVTQISGRNVRTGDLPDMSFPAVDLSLPEQDFERFESMVVSLKSGDCGGDIVISEYYNFDRYGEVKLCSQPCDLSERPFQFTELNKPNVEDYAAYETLIEQSCVYLEDGVSSQNPDPALLGGLIEVDQAWNFRGGDIINKLEGPLSYAYGKWNIIPESESDLEIVDSPNSRDLPSILPSDVTMAFSNLLNYWTTVGSGSDLRGADSPEEFERQSAKTILALSKLDVDFIAVCEVQNVLAATQDLVDKLNLASSRSYSAASYDVPTPGIVGPDVIKVDVLYDTNKYDLLGVATLTDADVDPAILSLSTTGNIFDGSSRVPLAATFESKESGGIVTIVPNHFKSKGSFGSDPTGGDADINDGTGNYNLMRTLSSQALTQWLSTYPTGITNDNTIICGDLNAYSQEDPISTLRETYYSAVDFESSPPPYTYVFDGQLGTLDYIFVSNKSRGSLNLQDSSIWHVNTDEPDIIDYNLNFGRNEDIFDPTVPYRFSDHDVVLASFTLNVGCTDSSTFQTSKGQKDCTWVAKRPDRRCKKKGTDGLTATTAQQSCSLSCDLRCSCKDSSMKFNILKSESRRLKTQDFRRLKNKGKKTKCRKIESGDCNKPAGDNEIVADYCPLTCEDCYDRTATTSSILV